MKTIRNPGRTGLPFLQGLLPLKSSQIPAEILAGLTLAALAIPEVMGYTKISGTPVITGLYTILIPTVLIGFLTGVGIQVAAGQVSGMLGLKGSGHGTLQKVWSDLQQLEQLNGHALAVALSVLVVIVGAKKISRKIPGALIAVVGATAISWTLDLSQHMPVIGAIPGGLSHIRLPDIKWQWELIDRLVPTAFAMFVVILAQSAATSRAYAARYNERFSENTDLVGLALANIGAGLSGTFVVNGSPTKTQMVDSAGGRTQLSLLVTSLVVLLVLLFLTAPLAYMPEAVLSAIVFLVGVDLIDVQGMRRVYLERRWEFWVALLTTLIVVLVGVEQGILLAIVLSLIVHTRHGYRPKNVVIVPNESGIWRARPLSSGAQARPGLLIYRFTHSMYYANAQQLEEEITTLVDAADPPLRWFCIEASAIDDVDYSSAETLRAMRALLREKGVRLVVVHALADEDAKSRGEFRDLLGQEHNYETLHNVLDAYAQQDAPVAESGDPGCSP